MEIRPLTKDLKDDYLFFFDNIMFTDNPDRSKCYCYDYHFLGDIPTCTREMSRAAVIDLINENKLTGYLVFDNDKPIGWCNANNRSNYQRLLRDYDYVDNPEDKVCSIVCFLIHPDYRRQGIAKRFLKKSFRIIPIKTMIILKRIPEKKNYRAREISKDPWNYIKDTISR